MTGKEPNGEKAYDRVKLHYEKVAESRNRRLLASHLNAAQVNHQERLRIINTWLQRTGAHENGIDFGTGTGVWAEVLTDYCANVRGIDYAENNIKISRDNAAERGLSDRLSYTLGDAQYLQGLRDDSFDIATHISVLQHLPNRPLALKRVNDILRQNGYLILLVHNRRCIYNRNRKCQMLEINEYETLYGIKEQLSTAGFVIQEIRLCWLFIFDFLMFGLANPALKPFMPLRKALLAICRVIGIVLGEFQCLNPLFREIVIIARKQ